jgi:hypothetical protein
VARPAQVAGAATGVTVLAVVTKAQLDAAAI